MKKSKPIVAKDAAGLAGVLGLSAADSVEIQLRSDLNDKIIEAVVKAGLTHAQVAELARTSRSRITAILNRDTKDVSTDLMVRTMESLGDRATGYYDEQSTQG